MSVAVYALRWLWIASEAALLGVLWHRSLLGTYRSFAELLAVGLIQQLVLLPYDHQSTQYMHLWIGTEFIWLAALALAALELTRKMLEHQQRLGHAAVQGFGMIFALGVLIGLLSLIPGPKAELDPGFPRLNLTLRVLQLVSISLFGFLASLVLWFGIFNYKMRPNVVVHRWLLGLYGGLIPGMTIVALKFIPHLKAQIAANMAMMAAEIACLIAWCFLMRASGEKWPDAEAGIVVDYGTK